MPPFLKTVTVGQITVAGFMELLRMLVEKSCAVRLAAGHDIAPEDWIRKLREPEFNGLADTICKGERPGFFGGWLSLRNVTAIYQASCKVNDWTRIFSPVDWTGGAKRKNKGSLMGDVQIICRVFPGLDPMTILHDWPMEEFLSFAEAMNVASEAAEPEPMSVTAMGMIPGIEVIH